ncbi:hypothetical protein B0H13DRAFT_1875566 [Mycena leptocephala]|nr:hypothetical protein B0H13DRAFT_1875566 [Mycena leptocephala]
MADNYNITLDPCLIPRFPSGTLETMGTGEDADYIYEPRDFGMDADPDFTYPPPSQPSLHFSKARLAAMEQEFPPSPFDFPLRAILGNAMNLPRGAIPSLQAHATDAEKHGPNDKGTGAADEAEQSGSEEVAASKRGKKTGPRNVFGGTQLIQLARAIDKCKPYLAPHGGVGDSWKATNQHLKANGFNLDVKYTALQTKAKALIAYKKDPTCEEAKSVASHIKDDVAILIASTLEKIEQQYDDAKDKSDAAKLELKEKLENETMAGDKVRGASMIAHQKRKRSDSPAANDDDTDNEASTPRKASGVSATSSLELSDAEGSKKKLKRRKTDWRGESSTSTDIVKILECDIAQCAEHQQVQAATIKEYVADAREGRSQIIGLLEKLIASENKN